MFILKKPIISIMLFVIVIAMLFISKAYTSEQENDSSQQSTDNTIRVASANVYIAKTPTHLEGYDTKMNFTQRKEHILNVFNVAAPFLNWKQGESMGDKVRTIFEQKKVFDFIALQEVSDDNGNQILGELDFNNTKRSCESYEYPEKFDANDNCINFHHGLAVFFDSNRWSYDSGEEIYIGYDKKGSQPRYDRYAGSALFKARNTDTSLAIINVHGPRNVKIDKGYSHALWNNLENLIVSYKNQNIPVIVMGDFNVDLTNVNKNNANKPQISMVKTLNNVVTAIYDRNDPEKKSIFGYSHKLCNPFGNLSAGDKNGDDEWCPRKQGDISPKDGIFFTENLGLNFVTGTPIYYPAQFHGDFNHGFLSDHHFVIAKFTLDGLTNVTNQSS